MIEKWLEREVARGLQGLVALRLSGAPAEDSVTLTLDIWLAAIEDRATTWTELGDAERIRRAFRTLYRVCDRWPPPKLFIDNLGNRDPPRRTLPAPQISEQERQRNRETLRELVEMLARRDAAKRKKGETDGTGTDSERLLEGRERLPDTRKHDQADRSRARSSGARSGRRGQGQGEGTG
ncbi:MULTISPECIES: hypothetical protein [Burkholderia cepacia complex]|uniref:hypothetical protein n=1 Tax=Burkholderia cepacia complex TaxID=87882 RepID=UPI00211BBA1B|nr:MULTISPECIES: hypothetical protein [Burkholderia cepacia complex]